MAMRRRRAAPLVGDLPGGSATSNFEPIIHLRTTKSLGRAVSPPSAPPTFSNKQARHFLLRKCVPSLCCSQQFDRFPSKATITLCASLVGKASDSALGWRDARLAAADEVIE